MKVNGIPYLPFGEGPRHCIGMRLALVEAKIALVHVLRKVKFAKCEKTQVIYAFWQWSHSLLVNIKNYFPPSSVY